MKEKYTPNRRCVFCRKVQPQETLYRVVQTEDGLRLCLDKTPGGRSCYVCKDDACIKSAFEKNAFARSLRRSVSKVELLSLKEEFDKLI